MAAVFYYHVVGDLTVGKPEAVEFPDTASVADAIASLETCTEGGIPVWKRRQKLHRNPETAEARQERFVGIVGALDIAVHLSSEGSLRDPRAALRAPVSDVVVPNNALLRQVDPATRLVDALEMMKQGVRRLLVPRKRGWKGMSKRFSVLYNGKWLEGDPDDDPCDKWCCLSREDVVRFLIGCLGALAPLPLTSIRALGAITALHLKFTIHGRSPARDAIKALANDPQGVAVVEDPHSLLLIGEISSFKLWKCDLLAAGWALANLSAAEFVTGVEDIVHSHPNALSSQSGNNIAGSREEKPRRSLDFMNIYFDKSSPRPYRGRSAPLTCRPTNSLAAVMAQMLAHRATHVWVTEGPGWEENENLVGIVTYTDILTAVTRLPNSLTPN